MLIEQKLEQARRLFDEYAEIVRTAYSPDEKILAENHAHQLAMELDDSLQRLIDGLEARAEWLELGLKGLKEKEQGL